MKKVCPTGRTFFFVLFLQNVMKSIKNLYFYDKP